MTIVGSGVEAVAIYALLYNDQAVYSELSVFALSLA
jgi:hypothetical protein